MTGFNLSLDSNSNLVESPVQKIISKPAQISSEVKQTLDLLPYLVWMTKFGIGYCNVSLKNYIGLESNHICDNHLIKFLHPEDAEHIYNIWITAQKTGQKKSPLS